MILYPGLLSCPLLLCFFISIDEGVVMMVTLEQPLWTKRQKLHLERHDERNLASCICLNSPKIPRQT